MKNPIFRLPGVSIPPWSKTEESRRPTTKKMWRLRILYLVTLNLSLNLLLAASSIFAAERTFSTIDVPGATDTFAFEINSVGEIVGLYFDANGAGHGYLLSKGSFTTIAPPNA